MSEEREKLPEIRLQPTDGLTYNPNEKKYWDSDALAGEIERTFELCHSCRMCFKFCQSFPTLFEAVDTCGDVRKISQATMDRVVDECFQCKLCYTECPYTESEGHEFKLDFPRLMLRAKAVRRRARGTPLRERMLADPDRIGRVGCIAPALANWGNTFKPSRIMMEKIAGIHRDKLLPKFESPTFEKWFRTQTGGHDQTVDGTHKVVLFGTCFTNYNRPELGRAAFRVLRHNDCKIACPALSCCGMPALDAADLDLARHKARSNVKKLLPFVQKGYRIAVVNPTCSLMIRQEYPELLDDPGDSPTAEAAKQVAAATRDLSEYLFELRNEGHFKEDFRSTPDGPVAYHAPCHLRMQSIGFRGRDLMRRIPGVKPKMTVECCGHDGTWAMKTEFFELSMKNGAKAFEGMGGVDSDLWTSDCPLAAVQFRQACGREVLHPIEVLDRAYREDGFPNAVSASETDG
jgi:Fe-S oxidoreductase